MSGLARSAATNPCQGTVGQPIPSFQHPPNQPLRLKEVVPTGVSRLCPVRSFLPHDILNTTNTSPTLRPLDMPTSIRLAPETEERLNFLASQTGRTKAYYLREIIERGLEDIEDYYLAADVLERVRKGREQVHTVEEVRNELGLEG